MGSTSKHGRAVINPTAPEAVGVCDRCGKLWNLSRLRMQYDWRGVTLASLGIRVCPDCLDVPQEQLRTRILPPDPLPRLDARVETYLVDELNAYTLRQVPVGKVFMFGGVGELGAELTSEPSSELMAAIGGLADLGAVLLLGIGLSAAFDAAGELAGDVTVATPGAQDIMAAFDGLADLGAVLLLGIGLSAAFDAVSDVTAELTQGGAGGDNLLQENGDLLLLEDLNPIVLGTGIPALSAASALTGTEQIAVVQGGVTERTTLAEAVIKMRGY